MDLREVEWGNVNWINLAQERDPVAGACEHVTSFWLP
jgi:hypothetical protein